MLKKAKEKGFVKATSMLLVKSLRRFLTFLRPLPESSIVKVNGSKMFLLPKKGAIHRDLFLYKKREPVCTNYLMRSGILKAGDVVLDIGANIGYYVLVESQLVGKTGKVYAVEPIQSNFRLLNKNVQLNNLTNTSTFRFEFGDEDKKSEIYVSDKSNLCAVKKEAAGGKVIGTEEVYMETVDSFFKDKPSPNFIRMDVEGFEYEIIKGMPRTLKSDVQILAELHPFRRYIDPEKLNEMFDILEQNNFRVKFVVFEDKVEENKIFRFLLKKAGSKLPIVRSNISIQELRKLIDDYRSLTGPNVVFEKQIAPD